MCLDAVRKLSASTGGSNSKMSKISSAGRCARTFSVSGQHVSLCAFNGISMKLGSVLVYALRDGA